MHELAITQSILDLTLEHARRQGATRVDRINLVIGEMTGVMEDCVRFYLGLISPGTAAENAELAVRLVPITAQCQNCGEVYEVRNLNWECPQCLSKRSDIIGGKELMVESIEVSDGSASTEGHPGRQRSDRPSEPPVAR